MWINFTNTTQDRVQVAKNLVSNIDIPILQTSNCTPKVEYWAAARLLQKLAATSRFNYVFVVSSGEKTLRFKGCGSPSTTWRPLIFRSAVLFIVLLSALCSGWHTLHPEIVGYYQAVNLEAVHVPNNFACLIQFKICTAVIYQSLDWQSYPFLYSSIFISLCCVRLLEEFKVMVDFHTIDRSRMD